MALIALARRDTKKLDSTVSVSNSPKKLRENSSRGKKISEKKTHVSLAINLCIVGNGGCEHKCNMTGPGTRTCSCGDPNAYLAFDKQQCICNAGYEKIGTSCRGTCFFSTTPKN